MTKIDGYVAKIVSEHELLLNVGSDNGVAVGDVFAILDDSTIDVADPFTGEDLGSIDRVKAVVEVTKVSPRLSLARDKSTRSTLALFIESSGATGPTLSRQSWKNGVAPRDPARKQASGGPPH